MMKHDLVRYDAYRDSGVEWLNEIPQHWHMERVKNITKTQSGTTPQSDTSEYYENGTNFWVRTTDLNNDRLYSSEYQITDFALDHCGLKSIPVNSVLLAMYGGMGTIGKNSLLKEKVTINQSVSSEAIEKLKKIKPIIFSVENDFGNENKEKMYWLRVNSEYPNKKTDFSYLVTGTILLGQHSDSDDWGITIEINHIDVSTKWGLLLAMTELIAVWIDKKYGKDYGFEKMYKNTVYNFENIRNKKTN